MLRNMSRIILLLCALLSVVPQQGGSAQQSSATAAAQVSEDAARARAEIERIEGALPRITDRGAALFLLAKEYVRLGEFPKALSSLKECIALDEGFDPGGSPALQTLQSYPGFREMVEQVRRRYPPVHLARVAFTIPEKDLFPDWLAVDPDKHVFYTVSMHRKKIIMITQAGGASNFVKPDLYGLLGTGGSKDDPTRPGRRAAAL